MATKSTDRPQLLMNARTKLTRKELVTLRRDIHRHPELGYQEKRTSTLVRLHLEALGLEPRVMGGGTGVAALVEGKAPGKTLMVRCDLDALPVLEESNVPYRSVNEGVMHACGHDFHTAILLGTAKELVRGRPARGTVKLNFQPAEEGLNGAGAMIRDGIMENPKVDAVLGYHIWNTVKVGQIGVVTGPCMAAVDRFTVTLTGRGGHAAYPHLSVDPVVAAAHVVTALQTIVSRNLNPNHAGVVTVGRIQSGTTFNVIPPHATLEGTVRTFTKEAGRTIPKRFKEIVTGMARSLGAKAEIDYKRENGALVNDAKMAEFVREVARDIVGKRNVVEAEPSMGGEDHAAYQDLVPGCYAFVGAGPRKGEMFPHHHPRFNPDEDVLEIAAALMTESARRWLAAG
jgi:amidohydrolase